MAPVLLASVRSCRWTTVFFFTREISRYRGWLVGALCTVLCLTSTGWAQWASSGLTGTVTDPSGHGLVGVEVTAVQNATGLERKIVSSTDGAYYFAKLPVGTYTVTFSHQNFQS